MSRATQHEERLRILHEIDRGVAASEAPESIAASAIQPLRELLGAARAIVNIFDLEKGEVEWLAAAGRRRTHVGPGVRYSIRLMGDLAALGRGEPQVIDTMKLPPGKDREALLASGVKIYMAVPMIAGGELIGAISFGGATAEFPVGKVTIAKEVATQFAIAIRQARLYDRVRRQAEELEERVRRRTAELEAANRELESFAYSVSHDLRTPLRAINSFTQILLAESSAALDEKGRSHLGRIHAATQRMSQLIDDLLQLAQVSRSDLRRERIDLSELAQSVLGELQDGTPQRRVQTEVQPGLVAEADKRLVGVLLDNLLGNAWKFTSRTDQPRIAFGGEGNGGATTYFVRDNGAGFDMAFADKLFRPFHRLHHESQFPGTGIGLATVQRIAARHGGRAWAQGIEGRGATFYFTLGA